MERLAVASADHVAVQVDDVSPEIGAIAQLDNGAAKTEIDGPAKSESRQAGRAGCDQLRGSAKKLNDWPIHVHRRTASGYQ